MNADKTKRSRCLLIRVHLRSSAAIHCFFLMTLENPVAAHHPVPPRPPTSGSELNSKQPYSGGWRLMQIDKHPAKHDSQIARLEQVMTVLAEAQVKTEDSTDRLNLALADLAPDPAILAAEIIEDLQAALDQFA